MDRAKHLTVLIHVWLYWTSRRVIFDDTSNIQLITDESRLVINERDRISAVLRLIVGFLPMAIGGLIMYTFLSGGGPTPIGGFTTRIFGWAVVSFFFVLFGLIPFCWGFGMMFARRRFVVSRTDRRLQAFVTIDDFPIWKRSYALTIFEHIRVEPRRSGGPFGHGRLLFVVSCAGPLKQIDLAAFEARPKADELAAVVAMWLTFPVVSSRS